MAEHLLSVILGIILGMVITAVCIVRTLNAAGDEFDAAVLRIKTTLERSCAK